jgi:hypothetical protein
MVQLVESGVELQSKREWLQVRFRDNSNVHAPPERGNYQSSSANMIVRTRKKVSGFSLSGITIPVGSAVQSIFHANISLSMQKKPRSCSSGNWSSTSLKRSKSRIASKILLFIASGNACTFGAVEHIIEGAKIKVYSPAKTVADCFKFRSKVGTGLAIQALRECFREKKATMDELWEAAKVCRVANVMRPYMESLS